MSALADAGRSALLFLPCAARSGRVRSCGRVLRYDTPMADFLLILRGDASADLTDHSPAALAALLAEYEQWAAQLGDRVAASTKSWASPARVVRSDGQTTQGPHGAPADVVSGFYVVTADDLEHATRLCAGHPCLRFGSIEVRELEENEARAAGQGAPA
jgi:hypothetical protein